MDRQPSDHVDILKVRFPRIGHDEALGILLDRFDSGATTGVAFPDMSTMVLTLDDPDLRRILNTRMTVFNDGAGMAWAARRLGQPFPSNLNGTDLCPRFLGAVPEGTTVYLLGGPDGLARRARKALEGLHPHLSFSGTHHGYLDEEGERRVVQELRRLKPRVVLVGMGNPTQIRFIDRRLDDPELRGTMFLAVGGLMNYFAGNLRRAPPWLRRARLEWLFIVAQQPAKTRRYVVGIPRFLKAVIEAECHGGHEMTDEEPR